MQTKINTAVTLVHLGEPSSADSNAIKIARFMGLEIAAVSLHAQEIPGRTLILSADVLAQLGPERARDLGRRSSHVFVYGFAPTERHKGVLEWLGCGSLTVDELRGTDRRFRVEANARDVCRQFAGLSFGTAGEGESGFVGKAAENVRSLVRLGEQTVLLSVQDAGCRWMLSSGKEITDLDSGVNPRTSIASFFAGVAPLMMFLRAAFGNAVWHNDTPTACLIIDDPLLRPRYGYLNYAKLSQVIREERFSSSLAFIPWNYRRSSPKVAHLFASHPENFSICVHGCDHTAAEFGSEDYDGLLARAQLALRRMEQHRALTGLAFDRIMVFPQGIFSTVAPKALKACNYIAAVNSMPHPIDAPETIKLRDLLNTANMSYSDFPIFSRRHPKALEEIALDLFLGKPALLVVHHDYFRDGYDGVGEDVRRINGLDRDLQWQTVGAICSRACRKRVRADGDVETHDVSPATLPNESIADGREAEARLSAVYRAKVFVRRRLCEFRDNYVDQSPLLSRSARTAWNFVFRGNGMKE